MMVICFVRYAGRQGGTPCPQEEEEEADLSQHEGLRIRWRDAYTIIRGACAGCIHFGKQVGG
jgi:hypothetical protein